MALRDTNITPLTVQPRIAHRQLEHQVPPLVSHLSVGGRNRAHPAHRSYFASVKSVATRARLGMYGREIRIDGRAWLRVRAKASQLRMVPISPRLRTQYGARQQCLAPYGDQPLRVQVARMESPEAHALRQGNHGTQARCVEMILELLHEHREAELARAMRRSDALDAQVIVQ